MSSETHTITRPARVEWRSRAWGVVGALSITGTVSWGVLYYALLIPMHEELGYSTAQLTGAFSLALAVSAVAGVAVARDDRDDARLRHWPASSSCVVLASLTTIAMTVSSIPSCTRGRSLCRRALRCRGRVHDPAVDTRRPGHCRRRARTEAERA